MPNTDPVTSPNAVDTAPTKYSPPLDVRSIALNPLSQDPKTILVHFHINTPTPDTTNTPVEPTEVFKSIFSDINYSFPHFVNTISYEPQTMILQLEVLKQELIDAAANYKTAVSHPNKDLLITIKVPLKILTLQLQNH